MTKVRRAFAQFICLGYLSKGKRIQNSSSLKVNEGNSNMSVGGGKHKDICTNKQNYKQEDGRRGHASMSPQTVKVKHE